MGIKLMSAVIKLKNDRFEEYTRQISALTDYSLWKSTNYLKKPQQCSPPSTNTDA